jgi:hypothetical protein
LDAKLSTLILQSKLIFTVEKDNPVLRPDSRTVSDAQLFDFTADRNFGEGQVLGFGTNAKNILR